MTEITPKLVAEYDVKRCEQSLEQTELMLELTLKHWQEARLALATARSKLEEHTEPWQEPN